MMPDMGFAMRSVVVGLALWAGCVGHATQVLSPGRAGAPALAQGRVQPPGSQDTAASLSFAVRDGRTGALVSPAALAARLQTAQVIYVGEQHDSALSHRAQLFVLSSLARQGRSVGVGLEMLPQHKQPILDAFLAGSLDEASFLSAVDWPHTWGFDYALYRPIFDFCRTHGIPLYALNASRGLPRAVRQKGLDGLSAEEKAALPAGLPWPAPPAHQALLRETFDHHPAAPGQDLASREAAFQRFYLAQLVWDETMAEAVARIVTKPPAPAALVVLAGVGHVGVHAMPARAARRGAGESLTIAPVETLDEAPPVGAEAVDLLVVLGSHGVVQP